MTNRKAGGILVALTLAAWGTTALAAGEKVKLVYKATTGSLARYKTDATIQMEVQGQKISLDTKEVEKVTFTTKPTGEVSAERETESREASLNGQKLPPDEDKSKTTVTVKPDGSLVSVTSTDTSAEEKESLKLTVRLFPTSNPIFTDKEVGVGDKWSYEFKANTETGARAGKGDYELVALEKANGVDAARVKMVFKESEASPISATGTALIEVASGDTLSGDFNLENVPFPGPGGMPVGATVKIHQERTGGNPLGGKVEPAKEKTIDDLVKDYEKLPGLLTLYRKKEAGKDTVYAEIREDQLNKQFFLQATASTGNAEAIIPGDPLADILFKFEKLGDDKIVMVVPNIAFQAAGDKPIARSVKRAFPDGYLDSFKIEAKHPERKSLLINISNLFLNDFAQVGRALSGGSIPGMPGGGGYALDREKSFVTTYKAFPENLFIQTAYHFQRAGAPGPSGTLADGRSLPLRVNFNLSSLENTGFTPRIADPRVGYFYTEYQDFTDDGADTQMVRYILRWNVEKADPKLAVSPPKKPIVFWMDNAIPAEYRDAVRDGILMWNRAFLTIGIRDAIQVKQMPDDADFDHADMRYNVIRWSTTQDPPYGAIALFRVNPLTGQILNAGITVDAVLTRGSKLERKRLVDPSTAFNPPAPVKMDRYGRTKCELAQGALDQAWFGHLALDMLAGAGNKVDEKKYTNDFVRAIVAHEFGHILGLFHNFAASTQFSLDQLKDPQKTSTYGVIGSVMDYVPFNIAALKTPGAEYWTPTIGRYDVWAVQYGYSNFGPGMKKPEDELPRLQALASRGNEPGLAYHNDLVADQWDPNVERFDLGSDPLAFWQKQLQVSRYLLFNLDKKEPKVGKSYWDFTRAFNGLMNVYANAASASTRYIGGQHIYRNYKGDPGEKPVLSPVEGSKQRQALGLLNTYLFAENAFNFPKSYYQKLTDNPFPDFNTFTGAADFPMRDSLANLQRSALRRVFNPTVLTRIANNEFKAANPAQCLTLPTLFTSVNDTVWSEVTNRHNITPLRRQLQRSHLDTLVNMAVNPSAAGPEDAKMLAWSNLRTLKSRLEAARANRAGQYDEYTKVHLEESLMRVTRALNATQTITSGGGGGTISLRQLLGGSEAEGDAKTPQAAAQ